MYAHGHQRTEQTDLFMHVRSNYHKNSLKYKCVCSWIFQVLINISITKQRKSFQEFLDRNSLIVCLRIKQSCSDRWAIFFAKNIRSAGAVKRSHAFHTHLSNIKDYLYFQHFRCYLRSAARLMKVNCQEERRNIGERNHYRVCCKYYHYLFNKLSNKKT